MNGPDGPEERTALYDESFYTEQGDYDDYDPTPWCTGCGSMTQAGCHCGPIADNE